MALKLGGIAQKPGAAKIKQRPKISQLILHRSSRQKNSPFAWDPLYTPCLRCPGIFNGLGLIENDQRPDLFRGPILFGCVGIGCDDEVDSLGGLCGIPFQLVQSFPIGLRPVGKEYHQFRGEPCQFGFPVAKERCRNDQQGTRFFVCKSRSITCTVFPRPISSARQAPNPIRVIKSSHRTPWI